MNIKTLIDALQIIEVEETITIQDLMRFGSNCADSAEVMMYLVRRGIFRDAGRGEFDIYSDDDEIKRIKKENNLLTRRLSQKQAREASEKIITQHIEILRRVMKNSERYSALAEPEKSLINDLRSCEIVEIVDDEIIVRINEIDFSILETEVKKAERIKQRTQKRERRKAYREEIVRRESEAFSEDEVATAEPDEETTRLLEDLEREEKADDETERAEEAETKEKKEGEEPNIPDFSAISKRASELLGKEKIDKKGEESNDIFLYTFQGITGEAVNGKIASDQNVVGLIMDVSLLAKERREEVFGSGGLPFEILRNINSNLDKIATVYAHDGEKQIRLKWKDSFKKQIDDVIFSHQCLGFPIKFTLMLADESGDN